MGLRNEEAKKLLEKYSNSDDKVESYLRQSNLGALPYSSVPKLILRTNYRTAPYNQNYKAIAVGNT